MKYFGIIKRLIKTPFLFLLLFALLFLSCENAVRPVEDIPIDHDVIDVATFALNGLEVINYVFFANSRPNLDSIKQNIFFDRRFIDQFDNPLLTDTTYSLEWCDSCMVYADTMYDFDHPELDEYRFFELRTYNYEPSTIVKENSPLGYNEFEKINWSRITYLGEYIYDSNQGINEFRSYWQSYMIWPRFTIYDSVRKDIRVRKLDNDLPYIGSALEPFDSLGSAKYGVKTFAIYYFNSLSTKNDKYDLFSSYNRVLTKRSQYNWFDSLGVADSVVDISLFGTSDTLITSITKFEYSVRTDIDTLFVGSKIDSNHYLDRLKFIGERLEIDYQDKSLDVINVFNESSDSLFTLKQTLNGLLGKNAKSNYSNNFNLVDSSYSWSDTTEILNVSCSAKYTDNVIELSFYGNDKISSKEVVTGVVYFNIYTRIGRGEIRKSGTEFVYNLLFNLKSRSTIGSLEL